MKELSDFPDSFNDTRQSNYDMPFTGAKVIWLYGLSSAGKTTLAFECRRRLIEAGFQSLVLDGDELRKGVCSDLGYDAGSRMLNVCRAAELAKLLLVQCNHIFVSLMTPQAEMRQAAMNIIGSSFIDVYIKCDLSICTKRDAKGLYSLARTGGIRHLPGSDMVFEEPDSAARIVDTSHSGVDDCAKKILSFIS